jgi:hypothetical protein
MRRRARRGIAHRALHEGVSLSFRPQQEKAAHRLLKRLLDNPERFAECIDQGVIYMELVSSRLITSSSFSGGTILNIAYGIEVMDEGDPLVDLAERVLTSIIHASMPGQYLVVSQQWMYY